MVTVPKLIVKLAPATEEAKRREAGRTLVPVLQVTLRAVPVAAVSLSNTKISLFAVTAVVFTWQVPPVAFVAQEKCPAEADTQVATEGFAAVPTPAQFVVVFKVVPVMLPGSVRFPPLVSLNRFVVLAAPPNIWNTLDAALDAVSVRFHCTPLNVTPPALVVHVRAEGLISVV